MERVYNFSAGPSMMPEEVLNDLLAESALDEAEKAVSEKEDSLLGTVVACYRYALQARTPRNHDVVAKRFSAWIRKRGFGSERERALWHLAENFELSRIGIFDGLEQFRWAATMAEAIETMEEGRSAGGPGVKVSTSGGISLGCKATAAWASLDEADTIASGRPETWARYVWVEGESRCAQAKGVDALFKRLTAMRLDDPFGLLQLQIQGSGRLVMRDGGSTFEWRP